MTIGAVVVGSTELPLKQCDGLIPYGTIVELQGILKVRIHFRLLFVTARGVANVKV